MGNNETALFKEMLVRMKYPDTLIPVEVSWVSQQPAGTARYIIECVNKIEEWINERRKIGGDASEIGNTIDLNSIVRKSDADRK